MAKLLEEQAWLNAAHTVLTEAKSPLHYLDIKRIILERSLVVAGLQTTLESVLYRDAARPNARFKLVDGSGTFSLMTEADRAAHRLKFAAVPPPPSRSAAVAVTVSSGAPIPSSSSQSTVAPGQSLLTPGGKVKVIKLKRGPGRPRLKPPQNTHLNPIVNEKYRKKYIKLKKFAKKMLFTNAAVCDEVSRVEDKLSRGRDERRFLVKKLLNHQAVSEALCQMAAKQPAAAAILGQSLGPGALSKLPVGIAGPLSLEMNQESTDAKPKGKKRTSSGTKKKPKEMAAGSGAASTSSEEKSKSKKRSGEESSDPNSGSLRHLLTSSRTIIGSP